MSLFLKMMAILYWYGVKALVKNHFLTLLNKIILLQGVCVSCGGRKIKYWGKTRLLIHPCVGLRAKKTKTNKWRGRRKHFVLPPLSLSKSKSFLPPSIFPQSLKMCYPAPGWRAMALGSSSPPETRTEGVTPEKSDTEMVFVPEKVMDSRCRKKFVDWGTGTFSSGAVCSSVLFARIAGQCGIQIDSPAPV